MVYRVFVERRPGFTVEADALAAELRDFLGLPVTGLRIFRRYDAEGLSEALFERSCDAVFAEPQSDLRRAEMPDCGDAFVFGVEYLPGQYDQRADSAAQCIQLLSQGERPAVRTAKFYAVFGALNAAGREAVKRYLINPVEAREASAAPFATLKTAYAPPADVAVLSGFTALDAAGRAELLHRYGLAMDADDLAFFQRYFLAAHRDPTLTELRLVDTYWSDHCRHTTFLTELSVDPDDLADPAVRAAYEDYLALRRELGVTKPLTLMQLATVGAKALKKRGLLTQLDESEEINACTVKIKVDTPDGDEDWLLLFKNETHNHPTEIEPFGGAATCIGGAIRDPLSGRAYVYQAMRLTGAADPRRPLSETLPHKLPQRKLVTTAAAGYSSYGNQIGLATGLVHEIYHDGYAAKRLEIGAVIGAAPAANVVRETPLPGDIVILLGGKTGRDGCGGATGSSKSHNAESLATCGAEVQKGNAPEERKLQRLFRDSAAARLIKRCNDFGAGGVSVAIGELADGLKINLDAVPRKYDGLDGTELAISESQERMAVVVAPENAAAFLRLAAGENLEATPVAEVTAEPRLTMTCNGRVIVDLSREFLNSNGAKKHAAVAVEAPRTPYAPAACKTLADGLRRTVTDLNFCSQRGLGERFDSTIGAASLLMPYGGRRQLTPAQVMAARLPDADGVTQTASLMSWGFDPVFTERDPFAGSYLAVVESVCRIAAGGADLSQCWLTFQEYFERLGAEPTRWGKPFAALLGALKAQLDLGLAAIGGKDSMSGSYEKLDVPPTLVSFAAAVCKVGEVTSPEFKKAGSRVALLRPKYGKNGLPEAESIKKNVALLTKLRKEGRLRAAMVPDRAGLAHAIFTMGLGNRIGFTFADGRDLTDLCAPCSGCFIVELDGDEGETLGTTCAEYTLTLGGESLPLAEYEALWADALEGVFPCGVRAEKAAPIPEILTAPTSARPLPGPHIARPRVLIPVFPGTNCEYDTARAVRRAGGEPVVQVLSNLTPEAVAASSARFAANLADAQILFLPGGFSGGDEPDGSGKFITAFLRGPAAAEQIAALLARDGLIGGICNGFQALIKLGLVPYGRIITPDEHCPTLTYNVIGRHQSRLVRTRVVANRSPWLALTEPGAVYTVPVSHGEGRFVAEPALLQTLADNGQIATQYVDENGAPSMDVAANPNGSAWAIEGVTSPDGRVFGKMGHAERIGSGLYQNVPGAYDMRLFEAAVRWFS